MMRATLYKGGIMSASQPSVTTGQDTRVLAELANLGVGPWALWHSEVRRLPALLDPDEHIGGVVYGYHGIDFVLLVATDRRIIYLDSKPLFTNEDEISYDVISGISYDHLLYTTVTLHTRIRDYQVAAFNTACAQGFRRYIEHRVLERLPT